MISAQIIADSFGQDAPRLTTFELVYPRFIHAELMTHRVFSRNASSSRAIPVARMHKAIREMPALPVEWRMDEPGMQGWTLATPEQAEEAKIIYLEAMEDAIRHAERLAAKKYHKQHINRITEPYQHIRVCLTSTEWLNWDGLRDHPDAEPTIQALARAMKAARQAHQPSFLHAWDHHLPYIEETDRVAAQGFIDGTNFSVQDILIRVSGARCARTSYKTHNGLRSEIADDLRLFNKLVTSDLIHASPTEHQASPDFLLIKERWMTPELHGNFRGWKQFRKTLPNENLDSLPLAA